MSKLKQQPSLHILLISLILFGAAWAAFAPLIFMNSDVGLRFIQIQTLIAQKWQTFAIPYPTEIDPNFEYVPYYYAYSLLNGRIFFNISPFFPYIAAAFFAAIGTPGLAVVPVVGSALAVWGIYKLACLTQIKRPYLLMWTTIFGTPMLFYTAQLWDHTLGTGLAILGTAWVAQGMSESNRRHTLIGGILLGLSLGQRPELYLFVLTLGIAWLLTNWGKRPLTLALIIGGAIGVVPLWLLQAKWFGHPLGMAVATNLLGYGRPDAYPIILDGYPRSLVVGHFLFHIESRDPVTFSAAIAVLIGIGLFVFALRIPRYQKKAVLWTATLLTLMGYLFWASIALNNMVTGFISTFPLIGIAFAFVEKKSGEEQEYPIYRFLFTTTMLYLAAMIIFWPAFGAKLWGSRYLLTAYPLMLLLAFYAIDKYQERLPTALKSTAQAAFMLLLVTSVGLQLLGLRFNYHAIDTLATEHKLITEQPVDAVLSNHPFWPALMGGSDGKLFLYTATDEDMEAVLPQLYANDVRHIAIIALESEPLTLPDRLDNFTITHTEGFVYRLDATE